MHYILLMYGVIRESCIMLEMKNLHISVLKLVGFLSSCEKKNNESTFFILFYQVENSDQPLQGNLTVLDSQFCTMDTAFWILCQGNLGSGFQL